MPDIRLTRIDNRLIHGQVATQWCGVVGANLLLVANDEVANDEFRQGLMNMAAQRMHRHGFSALRRQSISSTRRRQASISRLSASHRRMC